MLHDHQQEQLTLQPLILLQQLQVLLAMTLLQEVQIHN